MWQYWLIAAGLFLVAEIIIPGFLVFWLGIAALISMVVSFFISDLIIQMTVFVISSAILIFTTKPLVKKFENKFNKDAKTNVFSMIGKKAIVTKDIKSVNEPGQIKIGGEIWSAESDDGSSIGKGAEVEVIKIDGVKAIVSSTSKL